MATLIVNLPGANDFRGFPEETNIDRIVFQATGTTVATFGTDQFGPGLISDSVIVVGNAFVNSIGVAFSTAGSFSAAHWGFQSWFADDSVALSGTGANQTINGSVQNDRITGGGGRDHLSGGLGDDLFQVTGNHVYQAGSSIDGGGGSLDALLATGNSGPSDFRNFDIVNVEEIKFANAGNAAVLSGDQIGAGAIARVVSTSSQAHGLEIRDNAVDLTGVQFAGWTSDDTLTITGTSAVTNTLVGSSQPDIINGAGSSVDFMAGRGGADTLNGGAGSDGFRYFAGLEAAPGEVVNGGAGSDTILLVNAGNIDFSQVTLISIEALRFLSGTTSVTLPGNEIGAGEILTVLGSAGNDSLTVTATGQFASLANVTFSQWTDGLDSIAILGSALQDVLTGSSRNDFISGDALADLMSGGAGDDLYAVDVSNDGIIEAADAGIDTVLSSASAYALPANVENLLVQSVSGVSATGNALANLIQGANGNDTISGLGNSDSLAGGDGDDTYVNPKGDLVLETADGGTDTVLSNESISLASFENIENLTLSGSGNTTGNGNGLDNRVAGNSGANAINGGEGNDTLTGGDGADTLTGGRGNDVMNGGADGDVFRFAASNTGNDTIRGFSTANDRFDLAGGTFSALIEVNGNTRLTHAGGKITVDGVTGLSLTQWNDFVLLSGSSDSLDALGALRPLSSVWPGLLDAPVQVESSYLWF